MVLGLSVQVRIVGLQGGGWLSIQFILIQRGSRSFLLNGPTLRYAPIIFDSRYATIVPSPV